ncbi:MAG: response regulator [Limisphaerales bacterium]
MANLRILVVDDEETEVILLRYALERAGVRHELIAAQDGKEAIDYLRGEPPYADRTQHPLPALMLLDLKMPRLTGFDVLAWLQKRLDLKGLPVVVLTSSPDEADRRRARQLGAAEYYVKPANLQDLVKLAQELRARWLDSNIRGEALMSEELG